MNSSFKYVFCLFLLLYMIGLTGCSDNSDFEYQVTSAKIITAGLLAFSLDKRAVDSLKNNFATSLLKKELSMNACTIDNYHHVQSCAFSTGQHISMYWAPHKNNGDYLWGFNLQGFLGSTIEYSDGNKYRFANSLAFLGCDFFAGFSETWRSVLGAFYVIPMWLYGNPLTTYIFEDD